MLLNIAMPKKNTGKEHKIILTPSFLFSSFKNKKTMPTIPVTIGTKNIKYAKVPAIKLHPYFVLSVNKIYNNI